MLIVKLYVNETQIAVYGAVRIKGDTNLDSINTYEMYGTGDTLKHRYGDGAEALAVKMLRYVQRRKYAGMGNQKRKSSNKSRKASIRK